MVLLALMIALSLVLSLIDSRIPLLPALPGAKIGLASIVTIILLRFWGWREALLVTILRTVLAWFFHGSPIALLLGLTGGIISSQLMALLFRAYPKYFSITVISLAGGVIHNLSQLALAAWLIASPLILSYLPYLILAGAASGFLIGLVSSSLCERLEKENFNF